MSDVIIINLQEPTSRCCICGNWDLSNWGVPVSTETALIIAIDSGEDWAGKPACRECWKKHEAGEFVGHDPQF